MTTSTAEFDCSNYHDPRDSQDLQSDLANLCENPKEFLLAVILDELESLKAAEVAAQPSQSFTQVARQRRARSRWSSSGKARRQEAALDVAAQQLLHGSVELSARARGLISVASCDGWVQEELNDVAQRLLKTVEQQTSIDNSAKFGQPLLSTSVSRSVKEPFGERVVASGVSVLPQSGFSCDAAEEDRCRGVAAHELAGQMIVRRNSAPPPDGDTPHANTKELERIWFAVARSYEELQTVDKKNFFQPLSMSDKMYVKENLTAIKSKLKAIKMSQEVYYLKSTLVEFVKSAKNFDQQMWPFEAPIGEDFGGPSMFTAARAGTSLLDTRRHVITDALKLLENSLTDAQNASKGLKPKETHFKTKRRQRASLRDNAELSEIDAEMAKGIKYIVQNINSDRRRLGVSWKAKKNHVDRVLMEIREMMVMPGAYNAIRAREDVRSMMVREYLGFMIRRTQAALLKKRAAKDAAVTEVRAYKLMNGAAEYELQVSRRAWNEIYPDAVASVWDQVTDAPAGIRRMHAKWEALRVTQLGRYQKMMNRLVQVLDENPCEALVQTVATRSQCDLQQAIKQMLPSVAARQQALLRLSDEMASTLSSEITELFAARNDEAERSESKRAASRRIDMFGSDRSPEATEVMRCWTNFGTSLDTFNTAMNKESELLDALQCRNFEALKVLSSDADLRTPTELSKKDILNAENAAYIDEDITLLTKKVGLLKDRVQLRLTDLKSDIQGMREAAATIEKLRASLEALAEKVAEAYDEVLKALHVRRMSLAMEDLAARKLKEKVEEENLRVTVLEPLSHEYKVLLDVSRGLRRKSIAISRNALIAPSPELAARVGSTLLHARDPAQSAFRKKRKPRERWVSAGFAEDESECPQEQESTDALGGAETQCDPLPVIFSSQGDEELSLSPVDDVDGISADASGGQDACSPAIANARKVKEDARESLERATNMANAARSHLVDLLEKLTLLTESKRPRRVPSQLGEEMPSDIDHLLEEDSGHNDQEGLIATENALDELIPVVVVEPAGDVDIVGEEIVSGQDVMGEVEDEGDSNIVVTSGSSLVEALCVGDEIVKTVQAKGVDVGEPYNCSIQDKIEDGRSSARSDSAPSLHETEGHSSRHSTANRSTLRPLSVRFSLSTREATQSTVLESPDNSKQESSTDFNPCSETDHFVLARFTTLKRMSDASSGIKSCDEPPRVIPRFMELSLDKAKYVKRLQRFEERARRSYAKRKIVRRRSSLNRFLRPDAMKSIMEERKRLLDLLQAEDENMDGKTQDDIARKNVLDTSRKSEHMAAHAKRLWFQAIPTKHVVTEEAEVDESDSAMLDKAYNYRKLHTNKFIFRFRGLNCSSMPQTPSIVFQNEVWGRLLDDFQVAKQSITERLLANSFPGNEVAPNKSSSPLSTHPANRQNCSFVPRERNDFDTLSRARQALSSEEDITMPRIKYIRSGWKGRASRSRLCRIELETAARRHSKSVLLRQRVLALANARVAGMVVGTTKSEVQKQRYLISSQIKPVQKVDDVTSSIRLNGPTPIRVISELDGFFNLLAHLTKKVPLGHGVTPGIEDQHANLREDALSRMNTALAVAIKANSNPVASGQALKAVFKQERITSPFVVTGGSCATSEKLIDSRRRLLAASLGASALYTTSSTPPRIEAGGLIGAAIERQVRSPPRQGTRIQVAEHQHHHYYPGPKSRGGVVQQLSNSASVEFADPPTSPRLDAVDAITPTQVPTRPGSLDEDSLASEATSARSVSLGASEPDVAGSRSETQRIVDGNTFFPDEAAGYCTKEEKHDDAVPLSQISKSKAMTRTVPTSLTGILSGDSNILVEATGYCTSSDTAKKQHHRRRRSRVRVAQRTSTGVLHEMLRTSPNVGVVSRPMATHLQSGSLSPLQLGSWGECHLMPEAEDCHSVSDGARKSEYLTPCSVTQRRVSQTMSTPNDTRGHVFPPLRQTSESILLTKTECATSPTQRLSDDSTLAVEGTGCRTPSIDVEKIDSFHGLRFKFQSLAATKPSTLQEHVAEATRLTTQELLDESNLRQVDVFGRSGRFADAKKVDAIADSLSKINSFAGCRHTSLSNAMTTPSPTPLGVSDVTHSATPSRAVSRSRDSGDMFAGAVVLRKATASNPIGRVNSPFCVCAQARLSTPGDLEQRRPSTVGCISSVRAPLQLRSSGRSSALADVSLSWRRCSSEYVVDGTRDFSGIVIGKVPSSYSDEHEVDFAEFPTATTVEVPSAVSERVALHSPHMKLFLKKGSSEGHPGGSSQYCFERPEMPRFPQQEAKAAAKTSRVVRERRLSHLLSPPFGAICYGCGARIREPRRSCPECRHLATSAKAVLATSDTKDVLPSSRYLQAVAIARGGVDMEVDDFIPDIDNVVAFLQQKRKATQVGVAGPEMNQSRPSIQTLEGLLRSNTTEKRTCKETLPRYASGLNSIPEAIASMRTKEPDRASLGAVTPLKMLATPMLPAVRS